MRWAFDRLGLDRRSSVLDLAAGTGKLTEVVQPLAGRVCAVEPLPAMRAALTARVGGVQAVPGVAEAIPVADRSQDAVTVGEAFHWFATDAAVREIHRVLRPSGGVALFWNTAERDRWPFPWRDDFDALAQRVPVHGTKSVYRSGEWRAPFERTGLFGPIVDAGFPLVHRVTRDGLLAQVESWSWIAALPVEQRTALLGEFGALLDRHRVTEVALPYTTNVHVAQICAADAGR